MHPEKFLRIGPVVKASRLFTEPRHVSAVYDMALCLCVCTSAEVQVVLQDALLLQRKRHAPRSESGSESETESHSLRVWTCPGFGPGSVIRPRIGHGLALNPDPGPDSELESVSGL